MSARHFVILCGSDHCSIRDLGSTNGTFVNGVKVVEAVLQDGDRIQAGSSTLSVTLRHASTDFDSDAVSSSADRATAPQAGRASIASVASADGLVGSNERDASSRPPVLNADSPWPVSTVRWENVDERAGLSVVIKATFAIRGEVRLAAQQLPIFTTDITSGGGPGSVRFESDLVPFKPRTDVVLVGRAHAPRGKPVTQLVAGLRVGSLSYGVLIFGDRVWQWQPFGTPTVSEPKPFTAMDLVYERAFGGIDAPGGMYCKENLVGTGFIGKKTAERVDGLRLPNIEDPRHPILGWDTRPKPMGFGFYGRGWMPRLADAGTYDEKYRKQRHPLPPEDFSYAFFNGAHPDLQVEGYLRGDEEVVLLNVCPGQPEVSFRLPGVVPTITVWRWTAPPERWIEEHLGPGGTLVGELPLRNETLTPVLDTLVFLPEEGTFYEVFRGVCRLSRLDSLEIARIAVTS